MVMATLASSMQANLLSHHSLSSSTSSSSSSSSSISFFPASFSLHFSALKVHALSSNTSAFFNSCKSFGTIETPSRSRHASNSFNVRMSWDGHLSSVKLIVQGKNLELEDCSLVKESGCIHSLQYQHLNQIYSSLHSHQTQPFFLHNHSVPGNARWLLRTSQFQPLAA